MTAAVYTFDVTSAFNHFTKNIGNGLAAATMDLADLIQIAQNESGRSGVSYSRGGRNVNRSAAGEAPAPDTGRMVDATFGGELEFKQGLISSRVVVNTEYAAALETGTEKMAARPFIMVTAQNNWNRTMNIVEKVSNR